MHVHKLVGVRCFSVSLTRENITPTEAQLLTTPDVHYGIKGAHAKGFVALLKGGVKLFVCLDGPWELFCVG